MTAFYRLPQLTVVRMTGRDRIILLQNLCTQDLRGLASGSGRELFITDVKGRAIGHGIVCAADDSLSLILANRDANKIVSHLDRYIIREDVSLADDSTNTAWYASSRDFAAVMGCNLADEAYSWAKVESTSSLPFESAIFRWPIIGPDGLVIGVSIEHQSNFERGLTDRGYKLGSDQEFAAARIEANWPWFGLDFDEQNLPQEVDRDRQAISFTKGCYLGQETIARLDALGQIQKKLSRVEVDGLASIEAGTKVQNDQSKDVGWITSSAIDPVTGTTQAFAFLRRGFFESGTVLTVAGRLCKVL
jgi:tRNA-modifying protein YgfZ